MNRRSFILGCTISSVFGYSSSGFGAAAPSESFGYRSTAEEVTAGIDLTGKTALVTGCNAGIGYETLRVLTMRGATVFGLARNLEKAGEACSKVTAGNVKGRAIPMACEHTDFRSVADCATAIRKTDRPIDILICNAGVYWLRTLELAQGIEKHFVINHLSHFILVNHLLDQLMSSQSGRVVVIGSDSYVDAPAAGIEFDNLSGQRYYDPAKMYGQSKLANGLFARELSRRMAGSRATSNVVTPGWVMTDTMRNMLETSQMSQERKARAKTTEQGASTPCYVATHPDVSGVTGKYFVDCKVVVPGELMLDDTLAERLWNTSETLAAGYLEPWPWGRRKST